MGIAVGTIINIELLICSLRYKIGITAAEQRLAGIYNSITTAAGDFIQQIVVQSNFSVFVFHDCSLQKIFFL